MIDDLRIKCTCGNIMRVDIGDSILSNDYRWYISYYCDSCGSATEIDGCGIDELPKEVEKLIIKQHGGWAIFSNNKSSNIKIKYILTKMSIIDKISFYENGDAIIINGTCNQIKWICSKLENKKVTDYRVERL